MSTEDGSSSVTSGLDEDQAAQADMMMRRLVWVCSSVTPSPATNPHADTGSDSEQLQTMACFWTKALVADGFVMNSTHVALKWVSYTVATDTHIMFELVSYLPVVCDCTFLYICLPNAWTLNSSQV